MKNSNIVIIGFMGSGKTTLGKKLAFRIKYKFVDIDRYIEKIENMTITEIFEKKGEDYFRNLETKISEKFALKHKYVIATGGGVIKKSENMEILGKNGVILYLKSTPEHIYRNIGHDTNRPLLQGGNKMAKIKRLMEERRPIYEEYADVVFEVNTGTSGQIVSRMVKALGGKL